MTFPEERATITNLLKTFPAPVCIVDLGAHEGEDTEWMLEQVADKRPHAVMVEADTVNFGLLTNRNLPGHDIRMRGGSVRPWYGAIAAYTGACEFHANRSSGGGHGSIYAPNHQYLSADASQWEKPIPVPCWTFDDLFKLLGLDHIDLLWVDIHGAEKDMIQFGQEALKHTKYLFMEAIDAWNGNSAVRMYDGAATSAELQSMLPGWKLMQSFPWNLLLKNEGFAP